MPMRIPRRTRPLFGAGLLLIAVTLACAAAPRASAEDAPAVSEARQLEIQKLQRLAQESGDSTKAGAAAAELKAYLAGKPDSSFVPIVRVMRVQALLASRGPAPELLSAIDQAEKSLPGDDNARVQFYGSVGRALAERGVAPDRALHYARRAVELCPKTDEARGMLGYTKAVLGQVQLLTGHPADALVTLKQTVADTPDSQAVLYQIGRAYEKLAKPEQAIDAYVRSAAVFGRSDTSAAAPLRALWKKQHGSLAGLDAKVAGLRSASIKRVALDAHRIEKPRQAPSWRLPDLDEKVHDLASYRGKVLVMDFWGSWCGPCRSELPLVEAAYRRYKNDDKVAFVGINWEKTNDATEHRQTARDYVARNGLTFPIMYDHERGTVTSYQIQGFPTLFVIDREGIVRYVNLGFDPGVDKILDAQIQSLLN
jgi:thiol-disulfide isomerase/thioredoxin